ncbi:hypothetical protein E2C01_048089 [Portunus trituberculatus]|uniref:Uncharacterized protein n=1 Tax=Portunus trituberculatus TaxID=210409 RepID=A0A5B7G2R9_PORTR|nr:hypothetical protein [Portunus trituberculatus]
MFVLQVAKTGPAAEIIHSVTPRSVPRNVDDSKQWASETFLNPDSAGETACHAHLGIGKFLMTVVAAASAVVLLVSSVANDQGSLTIKAINAVATTQEP